MAINISTYHLIIFTYFEQFKQRAVPMVFLVNGKPGYVINQWILDLVETSIRPARLSSYVGSICMLYDFCIARFGLGPLRDEDQQRLVADFIDARRYGTDEYCRKSNHDEYYDYLRNLGLSWKPTHSRNVKINLKAINVFDRWQATYHGAPRLNPSEKEFLSRYEVYREWQHRTKWDPFLHLFNTREHTKDTHKVEMSKDDRNSETETKGRYRREKAFPLQLIIRLIECCANPRDKMLLLLMLGGSLRRSEPLHIFVQDIEGVDALGQAVVRLEDPLNGWVEWGHNKCGTRKQFFQECYKNEILSAGHVLSNLMPRPLYGQRNQGFHAGFKGMTFSESDSGSRWFRPFDDLGENERAEFNGSLDMLEGVADYRPYDVFHVWWLDPRIGAYFYQCFEEYMDKYYYKNPFTGRANPSGWPYHPWLFINIENPYTYGYPLAYTAVTKIWERLKDKLIKSFAEGAEQERVRMVLNGLAWHSLRHFYGYYCANILELQMEIVQVLMHHAQINSTQVYYRLSKSIVKDEITKAVLKKHGFDMEPEHIILPKTPRLLFPDHWTNRYQTRLLNYQ
ncbi:MAG: hypothetical protein IPQ16_06590 [Geobacteraceae bacterium]|nr:hypothetical protein [Geobacteraceae bacterium]